MAKSWPLLTTLICLTLVTSACSSEASSKEKTGAETDQTAIGVEVASVKSESLDAISSLTGTLLPFEETSVSFQVGGILKDLAYGVGDTIKSGSILSSLDSTDYELQVKLANNSILQAQTALASSDSAISAADAGVNAAHAGVNSSDEAIKSAQANITAANAGINSAQASLDAVNKGARAQEKAQAQLAVDGAKATYNNLKTEASRVKTLLDEGLASKQEYDNIQLQVTSAQKNVSNAEQTLSIIQEGATAEERKQASAGVEQAQAAQTQASAGVGQSLSAKEQAIAAKEQSIAAKEQSIAAKGQSQAVYEQATIGKEQAEHTLSKTKLKSPFTGVVLETLVSEGQLVNPGDIVYKLGQTNQLKVLLPVPDKSISGWKIGDKVTVTLYDEEKTGTVSKIYPQTNASAGSINVEIVIPNADFKWVPGQIVKANLVTSDNNGILVPIESVISSGSEPYVFKVVKGKAVKTVVTTGKLIDNKIHIETGLKVGDQIVTLGGELLRNGDPLKTDGGSKK